MAVSTLDDIAAPLRSLAAGETLFAAGDTTRGMFRVRSGRIRLVRFGAGGRETTLFVAEAGVRFAEASLFTDVYHCDAVAMTEAVVALIPKAAALAALGAQPEAQVGLTADLARQVMDLRTMIALRDIRSAQIRQRRPHLQARRHVARYCPRHRPHARGVLPDAGEAGGRQPDPAFRELNYPDMILIM